MTVSQIFYSVCLKQERLRQLTAEHQWTHIISFPNVNTLNRCKNQNKKDILLLFTDSSLLGSPLVFQTSIHLGGR